MTTWNADARAGAAVRRAAERRDRRRSPCEARNTPGAGRTRRRRWGDGAEAGRGGWSGGGRSRRRRAVRATKRQRPRCARAWDRVVRERDSEGSSTSAGSLCSQRRGSDGWSRCESRCRSMSASKDTGLVSAEAGRLSGGARATRGVRSAPGVARGNRPLQARRIRAARRPTATAFIYWVHRVERSRGERSAVPEREATAWIASTRACATRRTARCSRRCALRRRTETTCALAGSSDEDIRRGRYRTLPTRGRADWRGRSSARWGSERDGGVPGIARERARRARVVDAFAGRRGWWFRRATSRDASSR